MMTTPRQLEVTDDIRQCLAAVEAALETSVPGAESAAVIEIPKLALAAQEPTPHA